MSNKKIRVVQVNKLYAPVVGGIERVVQDIAEGLYFKEDIDVQVLVCMQKGKTVKEKYNGVKVIRAGSIGTYLSMPVSLKFFSYFKKLSEKADIIQFHMPFPLADLAYMLLGYKGKVVLWWHSDIVRQKAFMPVYKPVMNYLLKRADCIIAATEGHIISSPYLLPFKEKCVIIPYGIDEDSFKSDEYKKRIIPKNLQNNDKKILFVGRLVYYKGVEVLIDAFAKIKGAHLYIIGEGVLKEKLEKKVCNLKLEEKVDFLGRLDNSRLKACLRDCDILAFPSVENSEAFGLVQLEAMIYKKPVINTFLATGVPFVSLDGKTGFTVEPYNSDALAAALQTVIDNDELREQFGENAYARVKKEFNKTEMIESVYKKYKELVE